jgi:hypothetical protein
MFFAAIVCRGSRPGVSSGLRQRDDCWAVMKTSAVEVDDRYTRQALFDLTRARDVEKGGRYNVRSGAINIDAHPWNTATMQEESTLMGSVYARWAEERRIWRLEMEEGFSFEDLLMGSGTLEEKALGEKIHGQ